MLKKTIKSILLLAGISMTMMVSANDTCIYDVNMHPTCYSLNTTQHTAELTVSLMCDTFQIPNQLKGKTTSMSDSAWFTVKSIGSGAFQNDNCLKSILIPSTISHIGTGSFSSLSNLHTVHLVDTCSRLTIDDNAFFNCYSLRSVTLPVGTDTLRAGAFNQCHGLKTLFIPNTVKYIGTEVWRNCDRLKDVYVEWNGTQLNAINASSSCFDNVKTDTVRLHIPNGTKAAYDTIAPWKYFKIVIDTAVVTKKPTAITGLVYNGKAQNLVIAGEVYGGKMHYKKGLNGVWTPNIPQGLDAKTDTIYYKASGEGIRYDSIPASNWVVVTIAKAKPIVTPLPSAISETKTYNGSDQQLFDTGTTDGGTLKYMVTETDSRPAVNDTGWGTVISEKKDAKVYHLWYFVVGNDNYDSTAVNVDAVTKEIEPKQLDSPTINLSQETYTYDGDAKEPLVTVKDDNITVSPDEYTMMYHNNVNAGIATVTINNNPGGNYNISGTKAFTIEAADAGADVPVPVGDLEYNAQDQVLVDPAGENIHGTWLYKVNHGNYSSASPIGNAIGTYTVYYKFEAENTNYKSIDETSFSMSIMRSSLVLTANEDPQNKGVYYCTFYHGVNQYKLPNDGTEAYAAEVNGDVLYLHKIAENDDILPVCTAVLFKAPSHTIELTPTDESPVVITVTNHLRGVDAETDVADVVTSGTCYVLSGHGADKDPLTGEYLVTGIGFYQYSGELNAHKAYIVIDGGIVYAPKKLRFVFNTPTGIEEANAQQPIANNQKLIENGVLYIIRDGVRYNALGQIVNK